jgi:membrane-associated phospholipid phosphatase
MCVMAELGLKPVDFLIYLALLAMLITALVLGINPHGPGMVVKYGGLVLVLTLICWLDRRTRIGSPLHALYPVIFIPIIFDSFANLLPMTNTTNQDALLIQLDRALLGVDPTVWLERFIHPVLTELLTWAYASYYLLPVILLLTLYWQGKRWEYDRVMFGIVLCFFLSYVGYFLVPAVGPRFTLTYLQTVDLHGVLAADTIRDTLNFLERFKQDAFPSAHTAVVLVVLFYAWQFSRRLFWVFLPVVVALIFSTVYLRYHYVVDVLAGILLAGPSVVLERMVTAYWQPNQERQSAISSQLSA